MMSNIHFSKKNAEIKPYVHICHPGETVTKILSHLFQQLSSYVEECGYIKTEYSTSLYDVYYLKG